MRSFEGLSSLPFRLKGCGKRVFIQIWFQTRERVSLKPGAVSMQNIHDGEESWGSSRQLASKVHPAGNDRQFLLVDNSAANLAGSEGRECTAEARGYSPSSGRLSGLQAVGCDFGVRRLSQQNSAPNFLVRTPALSLPSIAPKVSTACLCQDSYDLCV